MDDYRRWRHVFKLDPNKQISDESLAAVCESGTDAVIVGGTDGVTLDNTLNLLAGIRRFSVPCALEVSNLESLTPGFDFYFIPSVLNSVNINWLIGHHHHAVKAFAELINWDEVASEGYCILNGSSKAAKLTTAQTDISVEDIEAYALIAEKLFRLPIFYLEYSGTYGDPEIVEKVSRKLDETRLFYGGGINNREQAREMGRFADTVVVGNAVYEDLKQALKTVKAVKNI
ncbi:MAG TPA: heptaprenylglyceryl phosphate synthase [Bacillales bacterium]|nr:heptaprenylglyceryl phosphate synthase [Bacillales bacterium]